MLQIHEEKFVQLDNLRKQKAELEKQIKEVTDELVSEVGYGEFPTSFGKVSLKPVERLIFDRVAFVAALGEQAYTRFLKPTFYDYVYINRKDRE